MIERSVLAEPSSELRVPGVGAATSAPGAELGGPGRFPRGPGVLGDPGNLRILAKLEKCWHNKKKRAGASAYQNQGFSVGFYRSLLGN